MTTYPDNSTLLPKSPADESAQKHHELRQNAEEISDPVERADRRRAATGHGDVNIDGAGAVTQKPHGSMDETMIAKGKDHPEQGPYVPEHDHVDPDLEAHEKGQK